MFQKALSLMSQRCTSDITSRHQQVYERLYHTHQVSGTNKVTSHPGKPLLDAGSPPLGKYTPSLFYINQVKPSPMPPLKAWRGFTGNVYFEPIKVKSMSGAAGTTGTTLTTTKGPTPLGGDTVLLGKATRSPHKRTSASEPGAALSDGSVDGSSYDTGYAHSSPSGPSLKHYNKNHSMRGGFKARPAKTVIVDKGGVYGNNLSPVTNSTSEDFEWVVGRQNVVGSLCIANPVQSQIPKQPSKSKKINYSREKICRGSVAHRVFATSYDKKHAVGNGGELTAKHVKTPDNDKENKGSGLEKSGKLPPLDTSRSGKSQSESTSGSMKGPASQSLPKDRPYVKYSKDAFKDE